MNIKGPMNSTGGYYVGSVEVINSSGEIKADIKDTLAEGSIYVGNSSNVTSELDASADKQILIGNGTTITSVAVSGDASISNTGVVTVTQAATTFNLGTNMTMTKEVNHTVLVDNSTTADTAGGNLTIAAGGGIGTGNGGSANYASGDGANDAAAGTASDSGDVSLIAGSAGTGNTGNGGGGGDASVTAAAGGQTTGAGGTGGDGGALNLTAGDGGNDTEGSAGTGGNGGTVNILPGSAGTGNTAGLAGIIRFGGPTAQAIGAPAAKTTDATLTTAELLGGWITVNQGAAGTSTQTTPTGTQIDAALPSAFATGDSFDFIVINISTNAAEDAILAAGAGVTLVGDLNVASIDTAGEKSSSGTFRFRKTGSNAFTAYRIA